LSGEEGLSHLGIAGNLDGGKVVSRTLAVGERTYLSLLRSFGDFPPHPCRMLWLGRWTEASLWEARDTMQTWRVELVGNRGEGFEESQPLLERVFPCVSGAQMGVSPRRQNL
jgi:hypothetical protein